MKTLFRRLLRHYFAGQAMTFYMGVDLANIRSIPGEKVGELIRRKSYEMADAMLEARK